MYFTIVHEFCHCLTGYLHKDFTSQEEDRFNDLVASTYYIVLASMPDDLYKKIFGHDRDITDIIQSLYEYMIELRKGGE